MFRVHPYAQFRSHIDVVCPQSADPDRNARILKMSDPMRHLNDEEEKGLAGEVSYRTMIGARDRTKLHKEIRAGDLDTADGDDASTVKADDAGNN